MITPHFKKSLFTTGGIVRKYRYNIGIDAGTNTGFAIWDREVKEFTRIDTLKIHEALDLVTKLKVQLNGENIFVRVEDARQVKYGTDPVKAQGAGSVKRDASIWEDFLTDMKIPFEMVRPNNKITKLPAEKFKMITGYTGLTSSHARDAAMMVYGI